VDGRDFLPRRLEADKISFSLAARACSPELDIVCPDESWIELFLAGIDRLASGHVDVSARGSGIPFADLLTAFVEVADRRLCNSDGTGEWKHLSKAARESATERLLQRLSAVVQWCLYSRFELFRSHTDAHDAYGAFSELASTVPWLGEFFTTYAGLVRPVGETILFWSEQFGELIARWRDDRASILTFLRAPSDATILSFDFSGADAHNKGRSVVILTLTSGHKVVYKPATNALSSLWQNALATAFGAGSSDAHVLVRSGYSWHRYVGINEEGTGAPQHSDAHHEGMGRLLALGTALGATDLHYENFVAGRFGPQVVDHETILSPAIRVGRTPLSDAAKKATDVLISSVLKTGSLPRWVEGPEDELWNVDMFGWRMQHESSAFPRLVEPNTSEMAVSRSIQGRPGALKFDTDKIDSSHAGQCVARGFAAGWNATVAVRGQLAELVSEVESADVRVIVRDTRFYAELLGQSYMPAYCHDVLDRSLLLERLYRPFLGAVSVSRWKLCRLEHDALMRGDIPCFVTPANRVLLKETGHLATGGVRLSGLSPVSHAHRTLRRANAMRGKLSIDLIHSAFEASAWPSVNIHCVKTEPARSTRRGDDWHLRFEAAHRIFARLRAAAFYSRRDGSIAVIGASLTESGQAQQIGVPAATDTYSGIAGLGLLAASLSRCANASVYTDAARGVADTLIQESMRTAESDKGDRSGAFSGTPAVAFVLLKLGILLNETYYCDAATTILTGVGGRELGPAREYDVISGLAGACLVGGAITLACGQDASVQRYLCDRHTDLVAGAQHDGPRTGCWWPTMGVKTGVSGFAHGVAGIAAALARLHRCGIGSAAKEAQEALEYEAMLFDESVGGWPVIGREPTHPDITMSAWCYGGGGVLLALSEAAEAGISLDAEMIDRATAATLNASPRSDGLCHGTAGVALIEIRSGRVMNNEVLSASGLHRLRMIADRFTSDRGLLLEPVSTFRHVGGLMCGATGVGYALIAPEVGDDAVNFMAVG
jgi:type 2 lantibiotic biosynthesis protein LanM